MKKLIALLLALLMVSSAVIAVSAEGTGEVVPTAPTIFAQTEPVIDKGEDEESAEDDTIVGYNVRFLAAVHETTGEAIGFEVVAKYSGKEDAYSKAEGDTAMEGTMLYKNVMVEGESKPVTNYDADAIGMFAAGINGVPTNLDIVFEIKAYITYGESEKVETGVVTAQYIDGVIVNMTGTQNVYSQDFTTAMTSAEALEAAGITKPYGQNMNLTLAGKKLNIPHTKWVSNDKNSYFFELVSEDTFAAVENGEFNYMLQMDLDITQLSVFSLIFNGEADTVYNAKNSLMVALRLMNGCDSTSKGLISDKSKEDAYNIWLRHGGYNSENGTVKTFGTDTANQKNGYEDVLAYDITDGAANAAVKLTVVVNNTYTDGCQVEVFIGEDSVYSFIAPEVYDVTKDSNILVWAQESVLSIDNVKVSKITGDITLGMIPVTNITELYVQDFNNIVDPLEDCNVTFPYISNSCHAGFPVTINNDGQLQVNKHAWHTNPDYFAHLVSADEVDAADIYKFEADLNLTTLGTFGFTINNDVDESLGNNNTANLKNMMFVSFRNLTASDATTGKAGLHFRIAHYNASGAQVNKQDILIAEDATTLNAKFTMIVDSTYTYEEEDTTTGETITKTGCKIYLFLDNKLIGTVVYDNTYDVKDDSSIGIWAENAVATIDNIKFTGVKKNS